MDVVSVRVVLALLCLFGLLGFAASQSPPTLNRDQVDDRNATLRYGMDVLDPKDTGPGTLVSGTKVELSFFANVKENGTTPNLPQMAWNWAEIEKFDVACSDASPALGVRTYFSRVNAPPGGFSESAGVLSEPLEGYPTLVAGAVGVRIASTEFTDGSTIHFTIHCKARLSARDNQGNELDAKVVEKTIVATLTACNKVLLLATDEEYVYYYDNPNNTNQVTFEGYVTNPRVPLYKKAASDAMPLVRPLWEGLVHHSVYPGAGEEARWSENGGFTGYPYRLDGKMKDATALFFFTHGENTSPPHFRASVADVGSNGRVYFAGRNTSASEVYNYAYPGSNSSQIAPRGIPDYQFALVYACSVSTGSALSNALNITTSASYLADRCVAGFPRVVSYQLYGSTVTLDQHAKKLMEYLTQGLPYSLALEKLQKTANGGDGMCPKDSVGAEMSMSTNGDGYTRLRYVYLEKAIFDANYNPSNPSTVNTWFWVF